MSVAQVSNLLYRRASSLRGVRTICRLEIGETAGWKPGWKRLETCATSAAASPALQDIARYLSWPFIGFMPRLFGGRALLTNGSSREDGPLTPALSPDWGRGRRSGKIRSNFGSKWRV